jgi:hypothetical protein
VTCLRPGLSRVCVGRLRGCDEWRPPSAVAGDCSDAAYIFRPVRSETKDGSGVDVVDMEGPSIYGPWGETQRQGALQGRAEFKFLYPGQPAQVRMDFRYPVTTGDTGRLRYELMATFGCEGTVGSVAIGNVDTVHSIDDGCACLPTVALPVRVCGLVGACACSRSGRECEGRGMLQGRRREVQVRM